MSNGLYCGNTVKFNPETFRLGVCPGCGQQWFMNDDDKTAVLMQPPTFKKFKSVWNPATLKMDAVPVNEN